MSGKISFKQTWLSQVGFITISVIAISLAGCGANSFKPMYASSSAGGTGLVEKLRSIQITTIPGRVGQIIRNELTFQNSGGGELAAAKYRLDIPVTERVISTLVNAEGDSAGQIYQVDAQFKLVKISDDSVVVAGKSYGRAGFERFSSIFSNVRALEDAKKRAAISIAQDIKSQLEPALARI